RAFVARISLDHDALAVLPRRKLIGPEHRGSRVALASVARFQKLLANRKRGRGRHQEEKPRLRPLERHLEMARADRARGLDASKILGRAEVIFLREKPLYRVGEVAR